MTPRKVLTYIFLFGACVFAQQPAPPQLNVRIVASKDIYMLNERVMVQAEFTNLTTKTLCFPEPDQDCESTATGSVMITGAPFRNGERDEFLCHADGGGTATSELESEVKNYWIKLPPNAVYLTKKTEAKVTLTEVGNWRLRATYEPPEGAFNRDYRKILQAAAQRVGCDLPDSRVVAEQKVISVVPSDSRHR